MRRTSSVAEYATFVDVWPLVLIVAPENTTLESIEWFCARQDEYFTRRERFATIHDMRPMRGMVDAKTRKAMSDWMKARDLDLRRWHVASATVTDSALIRGIITAVHWFTAPSSPQEVTGSMKIALDFVVEHLKRESIPISAKLEELHRSFS
jgi:hypothetical protein